MKWLKAYISFNRTERIGIIALLCVLVILLVVRLTMQFWVKPDRNETEQKRLQTAWEQFKQQGAAREGSATVDTNSHEDVAGMLAVPTAGKKPASSNLFFFDPNTIDSAGLRKLGLKEKTTSIFLHWRAKGKHFYKKEDMKAVYTLTDKDYEHIAPYICIKQEQHKWE